MAWAYPGRLVAPLIAHCRFEPPEGGFFGAHLMNRRWLVLTQIYNLLRRPVR